MKESTRFYRRAAQNPEEEGVVPLRSPRALRLCGEFACKALGSHQRHVGTTIGHARVLLSGLSSTFDSMVY